MKIGKLITTAKIIIFKFQPEGLIHTAPSFSGLGGVDQLLATDSTLNPLC